MLTEKLRIVLRIYKQFDPSFSLICYYSFIFGLLRISIGLSVFGFVANKYKQRAIRLLSTIRNIRSAIRWAILKVILNYLLLPSFDHQMSLCKRKCWYSNNCLNFLSVLCHYSSLQMFYIYGSYTSNCN